MRHFIYDNLRRITPYFLRSWLKRRKSFNRVVGCLFGNDVYSESYYEDVVKIEKDSVKHIARWIVDNINPTKIIDVGCGPCHLLFELKGLGAATFGVDISSHGLKVCEARGLKTKKVDLKEDALPINEYFDLVICCEVAEHLEEKYASKLVRHLTKLASYVYFTAAEKSATRARGMLHYNEQPNEYWISLFRERGFMLDQEMIDRARDFLGENQVISYLSKPMIFKKNV